MLVLQTPSQMFDQLLTFIYLIRRKFGADLIWRRAKMKF